MKVSITNWAVKHYATVLTLCVGLTVIGVFCYLSLPRESFPDIEVPTIFVTTTLRGANPTDIESAVTIPLETKLDTVEGKKEIRSTSTEGVSIISVEFYPEVRRAVALQRVRDAVELAKGDISSEADAPVVKEFTFTDVPVLIYQLVGSGKIANSELYELADRLKDELRLIPGVLDVDRLGGREREIHVEIDPDRLHFYKLQLSQVEGVLRVSNRNVSAGASENGTNRIVMRVPGEFRSAADLFALVIATTPQGKPVYLSDVASVHYDFEDRKSIARTYSFLAADGKHSLDQYVPPAESISLQVKKRQGENILDMVTRADQALARYPLPEGVRVIKAFDNSKEVKQMVSDLVNGIITSLVLILGVVLVAMGFRNALLVSAAVPFSMLITFIILKMMGTTLNMMVLFALILALGMLLDDAIVVVENIYRNYCMGMPRVRAAMVGTQEVAWPVIASTATGVAAFIPMLFWPGIVGKFMYFLPMTVIIVRSSSLFVALVINPTLAAIFMRRPTTDVPFADSETQRPNYPLVRAYQKLLEAMLRRPLWTVACAFCLLVFTIAGYVTFGKGVEFFPTTNPQTTTISIRPPEGTSLDASNRMCQEVERRVLGAPGGPYAKPVANLNYATITVGLEGVGGGGGPMAEQSGPTTVRLEFVDRDYRTEPSTETVEELRRRIEGLDRAGHHVTYPLYDADYDVTRPHDGPPTGKPVSVDVFGEDLNQMSAVIRDMKTMIANTPGAAKPTDNAATAQPTVEWLVDKPRAGMFGLEQGTVSTMLQMGVGGYKVGKFGHGKDEEDIVLRFPNGFREQSGELNAISVPAPSGGSVPMVSVATASLVPGPVSIQHFDRKRVLTAGADLQEGVHADADVRAAFQAQVKKYAFPPGITHRFGGAADEQEKAGAFLMQAFVIALFMIALVLVLEFNSVLVTLIIMSSVVLSLMGVFLGLLVLQAPFGIIMTGIAVISLAGVVTNNAIVLLDAIRRFERHGHSTYDAIVSASMVRFRPVLLTATTTVLGLVPMALKLNFNFFDFRWEYDTNTSQFWQSMAWSVSFGMMIATLLTLGVVPCLYIFYRRWLLWLRRTLGIGTAAAEIDATEVPE